MVQISISDVNDNSPLFLKPRYDVAVLESVRIGSKLLKVAAQDKDIVSAYIYERRNRSKFR